MLLLWEYFWTEADWLPAPPPAAPPSVANEDRGSGKGHGKFIWEVAGPDFWDARAEHLKRMFPEPAPRPRQVETKVEPEYKEILAKLSEKDNMLIKAQQAKTKQAFMASVKRLMELSAQIESLRFQYEDEAIVLLLLNS